MKPSEVIKSLNTLFRLEEKVSTFLWGKSGIGKSAIVAEVAKAHGLELRTRLLSILEPVDLKGYPVPNNKAKTMSWLPPDFLPRSGAGILFLDEMNVAPQSVQAAAYQLVLNRGLDDYKMPDDWHIIAAGNNIEDRGVTHRMPSPLSNRFLHIDVEEDLEDFSAWAMKKGLSSDLISFLRFKPALLHSFDPATQPKAFPTPRSWSFAARIHALNLPAVESFRLIKGAVGEGPASEFMAYCKSIKDLPSPDKVLLNPDGTPVPSSPASQYAISTSLAMHASKNNMDRLMTYMTRLPIEFQVVFVRSALRREVGIEGTQSFTKWAIENESVLH